MQHTRTNLLLSLTIVATAVLSGFIYNTDVSSDSRYVDTIKKTFKTKRPLEVSTLNYPYTSYEDRHTLAASLHGLPKVGRIDHSHAVYFEKAVRHDGFNQPGLHYLEGHTMWNGKVVPVYYTLDFPFNQHRDLGNFYKDFTPLD